MFPRILFVALLMTVTAASGQTIYRTVTKDGKVTYSDKGDGSRGTVTAIKTADTSPAANSAGGDGAPGGERPCQADIQRYCPQAGDGRQAMECLLDHQNDISDACYESLKKRLSSQQQNQQGGGQAGGPGGAPGMQACKKDVQQYCKGMQPGGGRIINCLLDRQNDISDGCYDALAKQMKNRK